MDGFLINGPADAHVLVLGSRIVCRNCAFTGCSVFAEPTDAFKHLLRHTEAKHRVRRGVLEGLAVASAVLGGRVDDLEQLRARVAELEAEHEHCSTAVAYANTYAAEVGEEYKQLRAERDQLATKLAAIEHEEGPPEGTRSFERLAQVTHDWDRAQARVRELEAEREVLDGRNASAFEYGQAGGLGLAKWYLARSTSIQDALESIERKQSGLARVGGNAWSVWHEKLSKAEAERDAARAVVARVRELARRARQGGRGTVDCADIEAVLPPEKERT